MTAIVDKKAQYRDSLDWSYIENELGKIGVPFLPNSWDDEFLMAENLQNYFAEVIARCSLLEIEEEIKNNPDKEKLNLLDKISLEVIENREKYHNFSLKRRQELLIGLMKKSKQLDNLR